MNVATSFVTLASPMKNSSTERLWKGFGEAVKQHREAAHLSQDGLADRIDRDRQTVYRIEAGINGTKRETVIQIARALGWDETEALNMAGFDVPKNHDNQRTFEIGPKTKISLLDESFDAAELVELADEMELSYSIAKARIESRRKRNAAP
jgi:ribosome-binding protein aMBF1 (putative translation factor)